MKALPFSLKIALGILLSIVVNAWSANVARAQILLTVDVSKPSHTVITATRAPASVTTNSFLIAYGIDLIGFFTNNVTPVNSDLPVISSTLTTGNSSSGPVFINWNTDDVSISFVDLNLYHNNTQSAISFTSGQSGFIGTLTLDLTGTPLPAIGTTGNVSTSIYGFGPNLVVGQYSVVPEPTTGAILVCIGALAFLLHGARRRSY